MTTTIGVGHTVYVRGLPAPKGSKTAFVVRSKSGPPRAVVTDKGNKSSQDRLSAWKLAIHAALLEHPPATPLQGPLVVSVYFRLPRPASAPKRVTMPAKKPDLDKLARAALDVCTGILWNDDAQIVDLHLHKRFAGENMPGMTLAVHPYTED